MNRHVALLRGINVGGHKKVPMAALRQVAAELGWEDVATYLQSGNLVFSAKGSAARLEAALEQAIEERFGFPVPVVVRSADEWRRLAGGTPFPEAMAERPRLLHLGLAKGPLDRGIPARLHEHCIRGERVAVRAQGLWIDFVGGVGRSKLTPAVLDRVVRSRVTLRNGRTVQAVAELLAGA